MDLVIYTVVIGGDYDLPPTRPQEGVDFICFTDQPKLDPNGWTVRKISPFLPSDTFRSSRDIKIRPHRWLAEYSRSIYIDSSVELTSDPEKIWNHLIPNNIVTFGGFFHSYRRTIEDEFSAVEKSRLDYRLILTEQLNAYQTHHPQILQDKPIWGGFLARRHNLQPCVEAMEIWFAHVLRYSRRDQLSLPIALFSLSAEQKNIVSSSIRKSPFHQWPVSKKPKPPGYNVKDNESKFVTGKLYMSKLFNKANYYLQNILNRTFRSSSASILPSDNAAVRFGLNTELGLHFAEDLDGKSRVYVAHQKRLALYKHGIMHRQNWILRDYRLPENLIRENDVVIDIGANAGELGIWTLRNRGQYIAFEPDPSAFLAMSNNTPTGKIFDVALSDENGSVDFYLNTAEADSSLFPPDRIQDTITVRKVTLDSFFEEIGSPSTIRLLKVEAEGMEPEVLTGAINTLGAVEYVAVDAGPERGGENTVPGVFNILSSAGFEVIDCFLLRGTFLFRKKTDH